MASYASASDAEYDNPTQASQSHQHRFVAKKEEVLQVNNFTTHNNLASITIQDCRDYILPFLNDTYDQREDECTAFHNAYVAAQCPEGQDAAKTSAVVEDLSEQKLACCDTLERYYERHCETSDEGEVSMVIVGIILLLLLCAMAQALLEYTKAHWIPEACAFILVGASISGFFGMMAPVLDKDGTMIYNHFYFDEAFFLQILLPPTIFQAALAIDKPSFGRHLVPIFLFALVGTALSTVAIGFLTWFFTQGYLPLLESLVFGALISSLDPVATLSVLSGVGVDPTSTLYSMIAGESLLNDAVAIVLFDTLQEHLGDDENAVLGSAATYKSMAWHFVSVSLGSIVVAMVLGLAAVTFFWGLRGRQVPVTEIITFFGWALIPYYVAEAWDFSGIISILTMGFIMDVYILGCSGSFTDGYSHFDDGETVPLTTTVSDIMNGRGRLLSAKCCLHIGFATHAVATMMETIIFAYLGLFLLDDRVYTVGLDQVAIWSCVLSRAIIVMLLSWLANHCRSAACWTGLCGASDQEDDDAAAGTVSTVLDRKTQVMLFLAGIRGAVSFALVSKIPVYDVITQKGTQFKGELKGMTSTAIIFTLFVFGALAYFIVKRQSAGPETQTLNNSSRQKSDDAQKPLTPSSSASTSKAKKQYGSIDAAAAVL